MALLQTASPTTADKARNKLVFFLVSLAIHALAIGIAYQAGLIKINDVDSIPARVIRTEIIRPTPAPSKPTPPPQAPVVKPVVKKKVIHSVKPSVKKTLIKTKPLKKPIKQAVPPKAKKPELEKPATKPTASPVAPPTNKVSSFVPPQASYRPKPRYPMVARRRGQEGTVVFDISLSNNGEVNKVIMLKSSGSSALDRAARKAIKNWKFPASPFNSLASFKQEISFRLNSY